jgi:uncharacterized protein (DUF2147 family)
MPSETASISSHFPANLAAVNVGGHPGQQPTIDFQSQFVAKFSTQSRGCALNSTKIRPFKLHSAIPLALAFITTAQAANLDGLWRSESGLSHYRLWHCGDGICAKIIWIVEGPGVLDINNPDPTKRTRPVMGIEIVKNSTSTGPNSWIGAVYYFKHGRFYDGRAQLLESGALQVGICVTKRLKSLERTFLENMDCIRTQIFKIDCSGKRLSATVKRSCETL